MIGRGSSMDQVVFNFHDVILLMTALLCVCFAVLLLVTRPIGNTNICFLAAFLIANTFIPLHELILWGAEFKFRVRETCPGIYFLGGFAYFLDTALLYFYIKSLAFADFRIRKKNSLHFIPVMVFVIFMLLAFYRYPLQTRMDWITHEIFVYSTPYISMDFFAKLLRVAYCIACLRLIMKYKDLLKITHSNIEKPNITWLNLLVIGFLTITVMEAVLSLSKIIGLMIGFDFLHHDLHLFEYIGLSGYYARFILICTLVFSSTRYFSTFESVKLKDKSQTKKESPEKILNPEFAENIDMAMRSKKYYLDPDITLDSLAEKLDISSRDLSMTINRHFNSNFYEFINLYRIEESKILLHDEKNKKKTITDIYLEVGFNSKSVFNTFFKKHVGVTPSEYRQQGHIG
jgi:AraC-like DNA-binding protein